MKKIMFLLVLLLLPVMVYAEDYNIKTMIPIDTKVSVKTEKFDYNNFVYNTAVDSEGNSLITFESIKNNTISKTPISINILLFGEDSKNIGYVTYCTDKDLDSNYSGYKIKGYDKVPFSIRVVPKYFINGKSAKDVRFISVYDDNKYCQIGGYSKYAGLTLDEIVNGVGNKNESEITKLIQYIQDNTLGPIIIIVLVSLIVLVIIIMVISSIIKSAKNKRFIKNDVSENNEPVEETINLSYGDVNDNSNLEEESSISMGEVSTNTDNSIDNKDDNKEDDQDLTSFFN